MKSMIGLLTLCLSVLHAQAATIVNVAGDIDSFGSGLSQHDLVRVVYMQNDSDDGDFDSWDLSSFTWKHTFSLPEGFAIRSATLTLVTLGVQDAGAGAGHSQGELYDDLLFLDDVELPGAFDDVSTPDGTTFDALPRNISVFDLPQPLLPSLADGILEITVNPFGGSDRDALAIDYAELSISSDTTAVPETSGTFVLMLFSFSTLLLLPTLKPIVKRLSHD